HELYRYWLIDDRFCRKVGFSEGSCLPCSALWMMPWIDWTSAATSEGATFSACVSDCSIACCCFLVGGLLLSPAAAKALSTFSPASQNAGASGVGCVWAAATPGARPM